MTSGVYYTLWSSKSEFVCRVHKNPKEFTISKKITPMLSRPIKIYLITYLE